MTTYSPHLTTPGGGGDKLIEILKQNWTKIKIIKSVGGNIGNIRIGTMGSCLTNPRGDWVWGWDEDECVGHEKHAGYGWPGVKAKKRSTMMAKTGVG